MPYFRKLFPLVTFLIFGGLVVILWQGQNRNERGLARLHTEMNADQIRTRLEGLMNARMAALELLAERWIERTPPDFSQQRFREFAESFYAHFPGFMGINWIDPEGVFRWVYPGKAMDKITGKSVYHHPDSSVGAAFRSAAKHRQYAATPCVELIQGGLGFDTYFPLMFNGTVQGYLNGVFQVELIVDTCLAKAVLDNFWVVLYESNRLIYSNHLQQHTAGGDVKALHVSREIHFHDKTWQLDLAPKSVIYNPEEIHNLPFLIFGIAICAILSLLLHFLIHRMHLYQRARDNALYEVGERKRAEEALRNNEKKLEALLEELAAKNEELETFVYSVSHDLKTPIVTIEGFIGALREDFGHLISKDGEKYLDYMSGAAIKMELLINDLLELSRIGRLKIEKTEFPFADLIKEVVHMLQPQIEERGVEIRIAGDFPLVYGERKRLVQVMENLLSNGIKYIGTENQSPRIEIGVVNQNHQAVFFVRDNGIGIDNIYLEKIFEVFQRLPSAKKFGEGTGVGLAIVKRVIEYHGGRIWLESEPGKGTTFYFTLKTMEA